MTTISAVFLELGRDPKEMLFRRWNWKSAIYSSLCRATIFFAVNLSAGLGEAFGAMTAEFLYRAFSAGFYGAMTQAFRRVEPRWHGALAATALVIGVSHTAELAIHWIRGTPNLWMSILASLCFTGVSTLFNLHAMRQGVFVTGRDGLSVWADFRRLPSVLASLLPNPGPVRVRSES